ncbi:uncharacterized protein LOC121640145 [Melanotaenia boesemani]|uniref:uncharacterized protein LOC121640145 n=1 Tax=Melanotaenia boesemani TaxID=1250792 RepID=UPI001C03F7B9|nr:uncharacterized protein LOC121640145 [Melanotaenia boesemani]XP_041841753.1 uncharacterized protein LOC121640145 [Melanotaenia boesemani]
MCNQQWRRLCHSGWAHLCAFIFFVMFMVFIGHLASLPFSSPKNSIFAPPFAVNHRSKRSSIGPPQIVFSKGQTGTATIDLCGIVQCSISGQEQLQWSEKYICHTVEPRPDHADNRRLSWCPHWYWVVANTGPSDWGYRNKAGYNATTEPVIYGRLTIVKSSFPSGCQPGHCNPLLITLKDPQAKDAGLYVLGAYMTGDDLLGQFGIKVVDNLTGPSLIGVGSGPPTTNIYSTPTVNYTISHRVEVETGMHQVNIWLTAMIDHAHSVTSSSCVACSIARPTLWTIPSIASTNPSLTACILELHMTQNPSAPCRPLEKFFPLAPVKAVPPIFTPIKGNHTCFIRTSDTGIKVGIIPLSWCLTTVNVSGWHKMTTLSVARADLWWYCGGHSLMGTLPRNWQGGCTVLSLVMSIALFPTSAATLIDHAHIGSLLSRHKRAISTEFSITHNSPVYIDAVGVPRGVPDEYKLVDQVAAGFESIFLFITVNKNVDRINYIHYNIQRLTNLTRDAVSDLSQQLDATSLMAYQNRMALDFLLAEKGGVCLLFGDSCCTFIPNNTAPDGSVFRALAGLQSLSNELKEQSGVDNLFNDMLTRWFGKWTGAFLSIFTSLVVAAVVVTLCGCCCIPCIRSLLNRAITSAIENKSVPPAYQMPLRVSESVSLLTPTDDAREDDDSECDSVM